MVRATYGTKILTLYSILFCSFLSNSNCEWNITKEPRIVGGTKATDRSQFPYQALLLRKDVSFLIFHPACGGAIIHTDYVLTAAHCIKSPDDPSSMLVVVGNLHVNDRNTTGKIEKFYVHEQYIDKKLINDIALIKMKDRFLKWTRKVRPINLKTDETPSGVHCVASGFGRTKSDVSGMSELRFVELYVTESKTCRGGYTTASGYVPRHTICTLSHVTDICNGDSGGPLVCSGKLAGIVSFGPVTCGSGKIPSGFTDVAKYVGWIESHAGFAFRADDITSPVSSTLPSSSSLALNFMSLLVIFIFQIIRNL